MSSYPHHRHIIAQGRLATGISGGEFDGKSERVGVEIHLPVFSQRTWNVLEHSSVKTLAFLMSWVP